MDKLFKPFILIAVSVALVFAGIVIFEEYKSKPEILPGTLKILQTSLGETGLIKITGTIGTNYVESCLDYLIEKKVKRVVLRIHSFGGNTAIMAHVVSLIKNYQNQGGYVECQTFGACYSAALIVFLTGDNRLVAEDACFGIHNIDAKTSAVNLEPKPTSNIPEPTYCMNMMYRIMAEKSLLSEQEIRDLTKDKEWFYLTSEEMIEYGFAEGYIE